MKNTGFALVALIGLISLVAPSVRADITYTVNETVGAGSATGFITTDGTLGTLGTANILDWNLVLNDGTNPTFDLLGPLEGGSNSGVFVSGSDFTATSTQLLFNFFGTDLGFLIFQSPSAPSTGGPLLCFIDSVGPCGSSGSGADVALSTLPEDLTTLLFPDEQFTALTGNQVIASGGVFVPTPEPSTPILMLAGIGLGLVMRKRIYRRASNFTTSA